MALSKTCKPRSNAGQCGAMRLVADAANDTTILMTVTITLIQTVIVRRSTITLMDDMLHLTLQPEHTTLVDPA